MNNKLSMESIIIGDWDVSQRQSIKPSIITIRNFILMLIFLIFTGKYFLNQNNDIIEDFLAFSAITTVVLLFLSNSKVIATGVQSNDSGILVQTIFLKNFKAEFASKTIFIPWENIDSISNSSNKKTSKIHFQIYNSFEVYPRRILKSFEILNLKTPQDDAFQLAFRKSLFTLKKYEPDKGRNRFSIDYDYKWSDRNEARQTQSGNARNRQLRLDYNLVSIVIACFIAFACFLYATFFCVFFAIFLILLVVAHLYRVLIAKKINFSFFKLQKDSCQCQVIYWRGPKIGNISQTLDVAWPNIKNIKAVRGHFGSSYVIIELKNSIDLPGLRLENVFLKSSDFMISERLSALLNVQKMQFDENIVVMENVSGIFDKRTFFEEISVISTFRRNLLNPTRTFPAFQITLNNDNWDAILDSSTKLNPCINIFLSNPKFHIQPDQISYYHYLGSIFKDFKLDYIKRSFLGLPSGYSTILSMEYGGSIIYFNFEFLANIDAMSWRVFSIVSGGNTDLDLINTHSAMTMIVKRLESDYKSLLGDNGQRVYIPDLISFKKRFTESEKLFT